MGFFVTQCILDLKSCFRFMRCNPSFSTYLTTVHENMCSKKMYHVRSFLFFPALDISKSKVFEAGSSIRRGSNYGIEFCIDHFLNTAAPCLIAQGGLPLR